MSAESSIALLGGAAVGWPLLRAHSSPLCQ